MSQNIQTKDGGYVLILSSEEAELLGTLRFKHLGGDCQLYDVLKGLPFRTLGEFRTDKGDTSVFHEFNPTATKKASDPYAERLAAIGAGKTALFDGDFAPSGARVLAASERGELPMVHTVTGRLNMPLPTMPDNLPRRKWAVECNFGIDEDNWEPSQNPSMDRLFDTEKEATDAFRNAPWFNFRNHTGRYRAVPVDRITATEVAKHVIPTVPQPRKWVVQFNHSPTSAAGSWETLTTPPQRRTGPMPAEGVYTSRNEAYRQIKLRAEKVGTAVDNYRVVPEGTKSGAEMDRGYYTVQFFSHGHWRETDRGPGVGNRADSLGRYTSAIAARNDIQRCGFEDSQYRVKWHPSRP